MTHYILQNYWWLIISILGSVLVFLLFVQGGQSMLLHADGKAQRTMMVNSLGRKWEFTFTTLVTFGGAFFASFPLFYSTSFGGAYWLWMFILFSFVVQAVAYEYRSKAGNVFGTRFYDTLLLINGIVGPVLLGVVVASMFFGNDFTITKDNILNTQAATISQWGPAHGLEAIASWKNLIFGFMVFFLARTLASLYFINNIDDDALRAKQRKALIINAPIFVVLFLISLALILTATGVQVDDSGIMTPAENKYLANYLEMWWCLALLVLGVVMVLWGIGKTMLKHDFTHGIWPAGIGTVMVVLTLFWVLGFNGTAYYPSNIDVNSSLNLRNSSSSLFTLRVMSYVSILVPFVLAYIAYAWYKMDHNKITQHEMDNTDPDDKY
ncbi:MAG: cytochrome d ubiquinol oxidase subunit II [Muribaculaceae bacterium]|nr:cytochrome d ubiquinol oxidase subunit II [Muribaculaceae bacterium]